MKRISLTLISAATLIFVGCVTQQGTLISNDKVSKIKKGMTTRAEVEALLGTPSNVAMGTDGQRILFYVHNETHVKGKSFGGLIAGSIGALIPGGSVATVVATGAATQTAASQGGSKTRQQTLQVKINKDNIVDDFEFSDNTTNTDSGFGVTKSKTEKTVTEEKK